MYPVHIVLGLNSHTNRLGPKKSHHCISGDNVAIIIVRRPGSHHFKAEDP